MENPETDGIGEALFGRSLQRAPGTRWLWRLPSDVRTVLTIAAFSSLLLIPYIGAVGLSDPWETHYGEVARSMIQRNDYVYSYWESGPFYSKPPLTMWMDALGMQVVGTDRNGGKPSIYTEWGMRFPFALLSVLALSLLGLALARTVSRRVAYLSTFVLATMPLYFLLTRQVITDLPFVTTFVCAMACALIALFDEKTKHRAGWWYGFYVFCGLGTLAKELVAVAFPALTLILYAVIAELPWDREGLNAHLSWIFHRDYRARVRRGELPMPVILQRMYEMHLLTGVATFLCIAVPWVLLMSLTTLPEGGGEGETFAYRYFIHDQLARLTAGVHSTTPNTTFVYFLEQAGYAIFPWVVLVPGALAMAARWRPRALSREERVGLVAVCWALVTFGMMSLSATKFHHYVFPVLPGLAVVLGLYADRLWREGVAEHVLTSIFGFLLLVLVAKDLTVMPANAKGANYMGVPIVYGGLKNFTDLYLYNYERPYPVELLTRTVTLFNDRPLVFGDLVALVCIALGAYLFFESMGRGREGANGRLSGLGLLALGAVPLGYTALGSGTSVWTLLSVAFGFVAAVAVFEGLRSKGSERTSFFITAGIAGALVFLRPLLDLGGKREDFLTPWLTQRMDLRGALAFGFTAVGVMLAVAAVTRARTMLFGTFAAGVVAFALWFNWSHWVELSHHWTQRDLFWRYYDKRQSDEPIVAYQMDWKGETFYSRNTVKQIKTSDKMTDYINMPGRKWALVEQGQRFTDLQRLVGSHAFQAYDRRLNAKFVLVSID